ncbi:MAG: uroporphyrinogen decarboxylase/cobalamine-independent methonine synthase family protein [Armatimonadota bacterium]
MRIPLPERLERLTKWFNRDNDRPLLGFYLGSQYPLHRYPGGAKSLPNGIIRPEDVVAEDYLEDSERLYKLYKDTGGDLIWSAAPFFGIPWVEASLGCTVVADRQVGSIRVETSSEFAENPVVPKFSPDNPWVAKMIEFIPVLERRSAGRYPIGTTLMRGISDLLSALYGTEELLIRMYEAPDEIKIVAESLTDYWIEFGRYMMERLPLFHGGTGAFFYSVWCPGKTIWMQDDAMALLSPDMHELFIHSHNCRIAEAFEHSVMHLHPSWSTPVDHALETGIDVVELHRDRGGRTAEELYDSHTKVLSEKPLIVWGDITERDMDFILDHLPHKGLAINVTVGSKEQAKQFWDMLTKKYMI